VSNNTLLTNLACEFNEFTGSALDALFGTLHSNADNKTLCIAGNAGATESIATDKGWTICDYSLYIELFMESDY
jgi:hypothetical protein